MRALLLSPVAAAMSGGAPSYDPDAQAYFDAMSPAPSDAQKGRLNTLIVSIKAAGSGILSRMVAYVIAAEDAQAARLNLCAPAGTAATAVSSPTFTQYRGYAGNGVSAAINLGINNSAVPGVSQDALAWGIGVNAHTSDTQFLFGLTAAGTVNTVQTSSTGSRGWRCNSGSSVTSAAGTLTGRYMAVRSGSSAFNAYYDGALIGALTSTSASIPATEMSLLRTGTNYSNARLSYFWIGALSDAEALAVDAAFAAYLTAVGA